MEMMAHYDSVNHIVIVDGDEEGEVTTRNVRKATMLAMNLSEKYHCNLLLFDITNMKEAQSVLQGFMDMKDMHKTTGLTHQHKCAVVYNPAAYTTERASFIEAVVTNRPNPALKMFRTREDAIKWLKGITTPEFSPANSTQLEESITSFSSGNSLARDDNQDVQ